jgi:hypothetical protein
MFFIFKILNMKYLNAGKYFRYFSRLLREIVFQFVSFSYFLQETSPSANWVLGVFCVSY